jgi:hypothetical protein
MAERQINYIGISSQKEETRLYASEIVSQLTRYPIMKTDEIIYEFMHRILGIDFDESNMKTFLGREWSFVREEKFNENGVITIKPVRYHLTPKQIFTRLKYEMRAIHSDIWVNAFFKHVKPNVVIPVLYPNEADAIIERGGIIIRINDLGDFTTASREEQLMDGYSFTHIVEVNDREDIVHSLKQLIWHIENMNPSAFTGKSARLLT